MSRSVTLPGPRPGRRMSPGCRQAIGQGSPPGPSAAGSLHAMEERLLGGTGLRVSSLALGTLTWSRDTDEEEAASLLHDFVDAGGTLVDTAASYADGAAEALVGNLLGGVVAREDVLLCTKAGIRRTAAGGVVDASRGSLLSTLDASLARLGTDHVDLWLVQSPYPRTPLEESVGALRHALDTGRTRYVGLSNHSGWQTARAASLLEPDHRLAAVEVEYSLLQRGIEREVVPAATHLGVGVLAWSPLGRGVLTGKYRRPGVGGHRAAVLAREHPAAKRRPGQDADAEVRGRREDLAFDPALKQRVLDLDGGQPVVRLEQGRGPGGLPAAVVGQADVTRPPGVEGVPESPDALLQRGAGVGGLHQPEVDVIGAETREGGIEGGQQGPARRVDHAARSGPTDPGLGAQQDVLARDHTAEQVSDQGLGCAVGVGVGRVDKSSAGVDEVVQQRRCLLFVGVTAPGQGAQRKRRDPEPGPTEQSLLHGVQATGSRWAGRAVLADGLPAAGTHPTTWPRAR